jgi:4-hydroxy-tetrahydrodipicolinate reductase
MLRDRPDVVILATGSFIADTLALVLQCIEARANVISPCEQLAYPFRRFSKEAATIDEAAKANKVTVLGTGVNPGLIFDSLLAAASGVCWDVQSIHGRRVVDTTGFGENIHRRLGIGYPAHEFADSRRAGTIAGHVGFPESIEMVCERLGVSLDGPVEETLEPLLAKSSAPTKYGSVPAGSTEGVIQRAVGRVNGSDFMQLELILHLRPEEAGFKTVDSFTIQGRHSIHLTLDPGLDPVPATAAQLVNSIPIVLAAEPGLKTVKDLPAPSAWVGDISSVVLR